MTPHIELELEVGGVRACRGPSISFCSILLRLLPLGNLGYVNWAVEGYLVVDRSRWEGGAASLLHVKEEAAPGGRGGSVSIGID